jgi:hypothetical protein
MVVALQQGMILTTVTHQSFTEGLKTAFAAAGYGQTPYAEFDEIGIHHIVYEVVNDSTKTFGTIYLEILIASDFSVCQRLHRTFNFVNNTGSNTREYGFSILHQEDYPIYWKSLSYGSEFKWVMLQQNGRVTYLGIMRPETMPTFWDENVAPYALVSSMNAAMETFYMADGSLYLSNPSIIANIVGAEVPTQRNPFDQQIDILPRLVFYPSTNEGLFGVSSSMIARAGDQTLQVGDFITLSNGHEYLVIVQQGYGSVLTVRVA